MSYLHRSHLLHRHAEFTSQAVLSQGQVALDTTLNSFTQTAADPNSLAAMTLGSFAFRFAKLGFLQGAVSSGLSRIAPRLLLHGMVNLSALGVEVTAFREANNIFTSWPSQAPPQNVFDANGWRGTFVDFLALKTIGHLGAGTHNRILTHFAQANAMVLGHQFSADLGFTNHEQGSYIQRLAHAEANNMALRAGMSFVQHFAPELSRVERNLVLRNQAIESLPQSPLENLDQRKLSAPLFFAEGNGRANGDIGRRLDQIAHPRFGRIRNARLSVAEKLDIPRDQNIGILTNGGDGPGENAVIETLVRGILHGYGNMGWEVMGIWEGFRGLLEPEGRIFPLRIQDVIGESAIRELRARIHPPLSPRKSRHQGIAELGGNLLKSSRSNPLKNDPHARQVKETLERYGIDALVVIGGNGSMGASRDLALQGVPLVFIPQSIDNDVPGTDLSVGFPSAVAEGVKNVERFYNTGHSCNRWFIVEVMGQHSGTLALSIAREANVDGVFVGEFPRPFSEIEEIIQRRRTQEQYHGVILVSEGVKFLGEDGSLIEIPKEYDAQGRLLIQSGHSASWLSEKIGRDKTRPETLAYLLRGALPTQPEITLGRILSQGALHLLATQQYGQMVGMRWDGFHWKRNYVPLAGLRGTQYLLGQAEFVHVLEELGMVPN